MIPAAWLLLAIFAPRAFGESALEREIGKIAAEARGKVAVACSLPSAKIRCGWNARSRPPMQSVFKFPLAMAVLDRVERGEFRLTQPIRFLPGDRILPATYSPLQDKYPAADVDVPLEELLRLAVSLSDNTAADVLLRIVGGPRKVDAYIKSLGVRGFELRDGEAALHADPAAQYRNWFEPAAAVKLLRRLNDRSPLHREHTELLLSWMRNTPTGAKRLKALLPAGTAVMHKTGTSGAANGVRAATNDIGLIEVAPGKRLAIAVFVSDAHAELEVIESVMARIGKAIYQASLR